MEINKTAITNSISCILHELGVRPNIKGYFYLRFALLITVLSSEGMPALTKTLYPAIAAEYGTSAACVERAMRHAIATAWERADLDTLSSYFRSTVKNVRGKPTNGEFIYVVAENIKMKFSM